MRVPPSFTRTDTFFTCTTLFRSLLGATLELDAMLAVLAVIGPLGIEVRLHFELVFAGLGGGDRGIHALDPGPFPGPACEAVRRGRGVGCFGDRKSTRLNSRH